MAEFTKERIIEDLNASTQNASGIFEISEDTICNLMSLLTTEVKPVIIVGDDAGNALAYRRLIHSFAPGTKLYTSPPELAVPDEFLSTMEEVLRISDRDHDAWHKAKAGIVSCRAAMLHGAEPVSQPYTLRDGYCIMPMKLTAENGAKGALSGEFSETKFINCPECFGDDECETCDGSGRIEISVPVSWTTIKEIWAKGVEHFAAAPQKEVKK